MTRAPAQAGRRVGRDTPALVTRRVLDLLCQFGSVAASWVALCSASVNLTACGAPPPTRYYELVSPAVQAAVPTADVLTVQEFTADGAYDRERIAYRPTPYRLDYYYYHRWPSEPGRLVADYVRGACVRSGRFAAVRADVTQATTAVLTGRVMRFEEFDQRPQRWLADLELQLELSSPSDDRLLWSRHFRERVPLEQRSPEGLAMGLSVALERVTRAAVPVIAAKAAANAGR
jgi:ABC-type uncharacterized transport system auxiliary subunit